MQLFDTHVHIGLIHEDPIEQLIVTQEARQEGVNAMISICNNLRDFFQVYENLKTAKHVYYSIGVSPSEVTNPGKNWEMEIEKGTQLDRVVAIGETGLDYYRKFGDKSSQVELFIRQLELASMHDLPVIIHNREAGNDVLEILQDKCPAKGGVLHCYSEDWNYAKRALDLPLYFSFAGNVTYRNAKILHETVKNLPLDRIVIESEAPFMVPAAYKGKRNKPAYLVHTADFIAEIRNEDPDEVKQALYDNSCRLFGINP